MAVLDSGITLYPLAAPFIIWPHPRNCWLTESIRAISAVAPQLVNVVEIMELYQK